MHAGLGCHRFPEKMQGHAEAGVASSERRACFQIAGRDIVQHDDVCGEFQNGGGGLTGDGRFDHRQARLDMLDQGRDISDDRAIDIIPVIGRRRYGAARSILHDCSPDNPAFRRRVATCGLSQRPVQIRVRSNPVQPCAARRVRVIFLRCRDDGTCPINPARGARFLSSTTIPPSATPCPWCCLRAATR